MPGSTITPSNLTKLQNYAATGDRYDYWSLLASLGDKYAQLALEVVTGDSPDGFIANNYAASYAPSGSGLADAGSVQAWWPVGVELMQADLVARQNAIATGQNPLNLSFQTIEGYHASVRQRNLYRYGVRSPWNRHLQSRFQDAHARGARLSVAVQQSSARPTERQANARHSRCVRKKQ